MVSGRSNKKHPLHPLKIPPKQKNKNKNNFVFRLGNFQLSVNFIRLKKDKKINLASPMYKNPGFILAICSHEVR